jgi:hypothetical protein
MIQLDAFLHCSGDFGWHHQVGAVADKDILPALGSAAFTPIAAGIS